LTENPQKKSCGLVIFAPDTPRKVKIRKWIFFTIFCVIILLQAFYWLFANAAEPIVLGLPWGMFIITLLIAIQFVLLLLMYFIEAQEMENE